MKKVLFSIIALMAVNFCFAQEGMWMLNTLKNLNEGDMKKMGASLSADDIYNINSSSLKDAIVRLNGGSCTAEVISDQGLVLTNHHCAYGAIQQLSSVDSDYLTNGFWAYSHKEELPIPGFVVSFLVNITDVTDRINKELNNDMTEAERQGKIFELSQTIVGEATQGNSFEAEVKTFFHGNEFYLFVYNTYRDVRLVGAPTEAIGKFGGDTDNWMWPRHTCDFSMIRIYADSDNNPADYSENNVPYKPKHFLPVSLSGVDEGDFTMIMGYPGSTDRFLSSHGVQQAIDKYNPSVVEVRDLKLKTMKSHMDADDAVRIKYAAKYAQTANYWKYYIGQTKGLKNLDVYGQKKAIEDKFQKWADADTERKKMYGNTLQMMKDFYNATDEFVKGNVYALEAGLIGPDINLFGFRLTQTYEASQGAEDKEMKANILASFEGQANEFYKDYDMATDKDLWIALMGMYKENIPADQQPTIFATIDEMYNGSVKEYADKMYETSFLTNKDKLMEFLSNPSQETYDNDLVVQAATSLIAKYRETFVNPVQDLYDKSYRNFVDGLRKMDPDYKYYPDANSTMRLSYGKVDDYEPKDGVLYYYTTTTDGILQKKDNSNPEFIVDGKLEKLILDKDFGQYADENGELVTCFISKNDITGGNSGSPVINHNGELIGLAFDGNWEAMSGDIAFEPELQRTISADIRYVMFIVDKYAGAQNIIDEITFASGKKKKKKKKKGKKKKK